jgi:hypothetical protein
VPRIGAALSAESAAGWESYAADHSVSVSALVEAVGLSLGDPDHLPVRLMDQVVRVARQVDRERRQRRPTA